MLKDKKDIIEWLKEMKIQDYKINDDLTIDVEKVVYLNNKKLTYLPVQFGKVGGIFSISENELTSLKGSPYQAGFFNAALNNLTTLEYAPKEVLLGRIDVIHNQLIDLRSDIQTAKTIRCDFRKEFSQYPFEPNLKFCEVPFDYLKKYYEAEDLKQKLSN